MTDVMRFAVDCLPTLASLIGESRQVPTDGFDAAAFLLGQSSTTSRDHGESSSGPFIKPRWPLVFDLIEDPVEQWDLMEKRLDCGWILAPIAGCLATLTQSFDRYPNIKPGHEFTGYI